MAETNERLLKRLRALAARTQSGNVHEAEQAAAMLTRLLAEHQLSLRDLETAEDKRAREIVQETIRLENTAMWRRDLVFGVAQAVGGKAIVHSGTRIMYVVAPRGMQPTIRWFIDYLTAEVNRLADREYQAYVERVRARHQPYTLETLRRYGLVEHARGWKNAFRVGAASEIRRRMLDEFRQVVQAAPAEERALVVASHAEVEAAFAALFPSSTNLRRQQPSSYAGARAGIDAGGAVPLHRPVNQGGTLRAPAALVSG